MERLDFGLACLWCLCVLGQGQGTQLLGLWQRHSWSDVGSVSAPERLLGCTLVRGRAGIQTLVCLSLSRCPFCGAVPSCLLPGQPQLRGERFRLLEAVVLRSSEGASVFLSSSFPSDGLALVRSEGPMEGQSYRGGAEQRSSSLCHPAGSVLTLQSFPGALTLFQGQRCWKTFL